MSQSSSAHPFSRILFPLCWCGRKIAQHPNWKSSLWMLGLLMVQGAKIPAIHWISFEHFNPVHLDHFPLKKMEDFHFKFVPLFSRKKINQINWVGKSEFSHFPFAHRMCACMCARRTLPFFESLHFEEGSNNAYIKYLQTLLCQSAIKSWRWGYLCV